MSGHVVVGIDPGMNAAFAVWGVNGCELSHQDGRSALTRKLVAWAKENRSRIVRFAVEGMIVGPSVKSSLHVENSAGRVIGALECAGFWELMETPHLQRPIASQWRSAFGFAKKSETAELQARQYMSALLKRPFPAGHVHEAEACCIAAETWAQWARQHAVRAHVAADAGRN